MSTMIEQNKYDNCEIHVAICLLSDAQVGEWIEQARQQVAAKVAEYPDDADYIVAEALADILNDAAEERLCEVSGGDECSFAEYWSGYDSPIALFMPAIIEYMERVNWHSVAELVLEHAPVAA
jgi:hypothetical protein